MLHYIHGFGNGLTPSLGNTMQHYLKALKAAQKAFNAMPSASNYRKLEDAMLVYQQAHYAVQTA